jgi:hypothetical protein
LGHRRAQRTGFLSPRPDLPLVYEDPTNTSNFAGFCDPHVGKLASQAQTAQPTDAAAARKLWEQVDRIVTDQAPWVPVLNGNPPHSSPPEPGTTRSPRNTDPCSTRCGSDSPACHQPCQTHAGFVPHIRAAEPSGLPRQGPLRASWSPAAHSKRASTRATSRWPCVHARLPNDASPTTQRRPDQEICRNSASATPAIPEHSSDRRHHRIAACSRYWRPASPPRLAPYRRLGARSPPPGPSLSVAFYRRSRCGVTRPWRSWWARRPSML